MSKKVVVDAGHGGSDPGASGNGIIEKEYTLKMSQYISDRLDQLGIENTLVRDSDVTLSPEDRVKAVLDIYGNGTDVIVLSNHINAGGGDGAEVIYALRNNDSLSKLIALNMEEAGQNFRKYYQRRSVSDPSKDYYFIIRDTANTEAILMEYGFLDSTGDDVEQLKNDWKELSEAVVKSLAVYIGVPYVSPVGGDFYTVKSGDTLWSIARTLNTTVDKLKDVNSLTDNLLSVGQVLKIPSTSTPDITEEDVNTYIVKSGDNLYSIANKYDVTVDEIIKYNNLTSNVLSIGQKLYIPKVVKNYTVKSGDSLYKIAMNYGITVDELKKLNNLSSDLLSIGQELIIPGVGSSIVYTVMPGDNLYSIGRKYDVSVNYLKDLNKLSSDILSIGQKIKIR